MGVGGRRHAKTALPTGKDPVPIVQEAEQAQGQSRWVWKLSPPTGIRSPDRPACKLSRPVFLHTQNLAIASPSSRNIRRTRSQLHSQQHISTQHDMLPQHPVCKNELDSECGISNQLDVTQYYIYFFLFLLISCSTCFGPPCAHLQELTTYWYFFTCGVVSWLCRQSDPVSCLCVHWEVRTF